MVSPASDRTESANTFRLVAANGDFLAVSGIRRSLPEADDYWDGNWLEAEVTLQAGGTSARFVLDIRAEEVLAFRNAVAQLYDTLSGVACFATMEEQLSIRLSGDGKGQIEAEGETRDVAGTGNRVLFSMSLDQTMLAPLLKDLSLVVAVHPVRKAGR